MIRLYGPGRVGGQVRLPEFAYQFRPGQVAAAGQGAFHDLLAVGNDFFGKLQLPETRSEQRPHVRGG
jgi:hypothetical protein